MNLTLLRQHHLQYNCMTYSAHPHLKLKILLRFVCAFTIHIALAAATKVTYWLMAEITAIILNFNLLKIMMYLFF
jgi:hypothetical protein